MGISRISYVLAFAFTLAPTDDPWSLMRRTYTGASLVLVWLALLLFLLPRLLTVVGLFLLSEYQEVATDAVRIANEGFQATDEGVAQAIMTELGTGTTYPLWQVALGTHRDGWGSYGWALLIAVLLCYNLGRFSLTLRVAPLRDAEERSSVTPARADYEGLYRAHQVLKAIGLIASLVLVYNAVLFVWWLVTTDIALFGW